MPISGIAPFNVQFTDTSNANATAWAWQFGDGTTSISQNPAHAYTVPGTYTVLLTITTPNGVAVHADTVTVGSSTRTGMSAGWRMDELSGSRLDSIGSRDLTPVNSPAVVAGKYRGAVSFVFANSQYLIGSPQVDLDGSLGITLTCWLNVRAGAPTNQRYIDNGAPFTSQIILGTGNVNPLNLEWQVRNDSGGSTTAGDTLAAYDTWYFVACIYDPTTGLASISVDDGAFTPAVSPIVGGDPTIDTDFGTGRILMGGGTSGGFCTCYLEDVALFNRVLDAREITEIFSVGLTTAVVTPTAWTPSAQGAGTPGYDPQVMLRLSNDGGKNWISEQWRSAGKLGEFERRVKWNRLGMARRRVFEVSVTDPIPWRLTGAYLKMRSSKKG